MKYRVAVLGAGKIAAAHLNAIAALPDRLQAVAAADVMLERVNEYAAKYDIKGYTDYKEMIVVEKPDIAIVALPPFLHKEAAVFCAEHGCHVLLEKPMALNAQECSEIIAAAEANQVKLMVGHSVHYAAANRKVKQWVEEGRLGELVMINDVRHVDYFVDSRLPWSFEKEKAGGGILFNLGSHSIDKIQWITNSKVNKVRASLSYEEPRRGDVEGGGIVFVETESGIPATICQSAYKGVPRNEIEFIFTKGMMKLDWRVFVSEDNEYKEIQPDEQEPAFVLQLKDLLASIEDDAELECSGEYGKSVIEVIDAMYASHDQGCEIIIKR